MKKINFLNRELERKFIPLASRFNYAGIENAEGVWLENKLDEPAFELFRVTPATERGNQGQA